MSYYTNALAVYLILSKGDTDGFGLILLVGRVSKACLTHDVVYLCVFYRCFIFVDSITRNYCHGNFPLLKFKSY